MLEFPSSEEFQKVINEMSDVSDIEKDILISQLQATKSIMKIINVIEGQQDVLKFHQKSIEDLNDQIRKIDRDLTILMIDFLIFIVLLMINIIVK